MEVLLQTYIRILQLKNRREDILKQNVDLKIKIDERMELPEDNKKDLKYYGDAWTDGTQFSG